MGWKRAGVAVMMLAALSGCGEEKADLERVMVGSWRSDTTEYLVFRKRGNGKAAFQGDMLEYTLRWQLDRTTEPMGLTLQLTSGLRKFGSLEGTVSMSGSKLTLSGFNHDQLNGAFMRIPKDQQPN